jgi:hypothetical protein
VGKGLQMSESTVYSVSIFLSTWHIRKVFYVKVTDFNELYISHTVTLICIMYSFAEKQQSYL